jgi:integrase/recombinase XerC
MSNPHSPIFGEARPSEAVSDMPLSAVVREYIRLYAEGVSHTAKAKRLDTDRFLGFLCRYRRAKEIDALKVRDWDFSSTQRFVDESLKIGESPATVSRRLATLKHMGRVLSERLSGFINPAREVRPPKEQPTRPKSIETSEVEEIKKIARSRREGKGNFISLRNETILALLLDTGLRADEIRGIRMSQLDQQLQWIDQVRTKGRRFRKVYITTQMRDNLKVYLSAREQELKRFFPKLNPSIDAKLPLFISVYKASAADTRSFEMGAKTIWRAVRSFSVDTKLHPHLLRHTFATDLLEDSKDIRLVAQALGHSDVRVTMRYTERGDEEVAQAVEKARNKRS